MWVVPAGAITRSAPSGWARASRVAIARKVLLMASVLLSPDAAVIVVRAVVARLFALNVMRVSPPAVASAAVMPAAKRWRAGTTVES
jgi:hypothetical protein